MPFFSNDLEGTDINYKEDFISAKKKFNLKWEKNKIYKYNSLKNIDLRAFSRRNLKLFTGLKKLKETRL